MSAVGDVLPSNSGAFERAVAAGASDTLPIPYRDILDPATTPIAWLPWLAADQSVDLWYDDWPVARKRQIIAEWPDLAAIKGTLECAVRLLAYVDAELIDRIAYPARFIADLSAANIVPIDHPHHFARYLIKVELEPRFGQLVADVSAADFASAQIIDFEPVLRAKRALLVSKAPETEYIVSASWRRPITVGDAVPLSSQPKVGGFRDRTRLGN